ncbi:DNA polymerase beta isoform X2 [Cucumis melo var. makuwa]|uniref:DNA polymerase n=1 Tax=Cucumis melo var. makuwa TaxID=1194695 RepID=A0A5D3CUL1_CUCMM|nr:DNA polymerase beta isoform X2 [Cucumis melo var. makuwa]
MAPKRRKSQSLSEDPHGMFAGMVVFLVEKGVQTRRLQIWKQKLVQMGASIEERLSKMVSHIFASSSDALLEKVDSARLARFKGVLSYQWLEDSLSSGEKASEDLYTVKVGLDEDGRDNPQQSTPKKLKLSPNNSEAVSFESGGDSDASTLVTKTATGLEDSKLSIGQTVTSPRTSASVGNNTSLSYSPPDMNKNITEIFGKLINIYRALGDERRSFSYYKAIPVIEKLPFKIESIDQVKHLPAIGKSLQDHIQEIVTTGKLSKLEHFETDEKVRTISLFGEVWGIGPATALRLYEKGYRTLDDLQKEESLTHAQKLGLKYFDDIKQRIPRNEVQDMENLLKKAGEDVLPGVDILCGGSFRRGKSSCGDMDIVITHPDGKSHRGFLPKYVKHLKDMKFLREDLIFSTHSEEVYPRDIYAFGLIAWTGNDVLNRRLRLLAESKGFRLDDTGLYPSTQGSGGKRGARGTATLKFDTEKEETEKFRAHLLQKLSKKDIYGDSLQQVVGICTEIFNTFMHTEYGGPGTLLVLPFIDMSDTINERGLPGGPQAARAAVKWAQDHVDKDWNQWTGDDAT